jgi:hypothetical protein
MYCSRDCQFEDWKAHKKSCVKTGEKLLDRTSLLKMSNAIFRAEQECDWDFIAKHDKYIDQLLMPKKQEYHQKLLKTFAFAYNNLISDRHEAAHTMAVIQINLRRVLLFTSLNAYWQVGVLLNLIGFSSYECGNFEQSLDCFEKARVACYKAPSVGVECDSMIGLALICLARGVPTSIAGGDRNDGLDMLRSANFAADLVTDDQNKQKLHSLRQLLFWVLRYADTFDEAVTLCDEYHLLATQTSIAMKKLSKSEVNSYVAKARIDQKREDTDSFHKTVVELMERMTEMRPTDMHHARQLLGALEEIKNIGYGPPLSFATTPDLETMWGNEVLALQKVGRIQTTVSAFNIIHPVW